jgi:hypothetical protein
MRCIFAPLLLMFLFVHRVAGQDTLPKFSAIIKANGKILISWRNNYPVINQISIQRSSDSLKNFTTLLTVPDPSIPENGFVDSKPPKSDMYYRLFILLENSKYTFSKSKRAISELAAADQKTATPEEVEALPKIDNQRIYYLQDNSPRQKADIASPARINDVAKIEIEKTIYIKVKDSVVGKLSPKSLRQFRDSLLNKTKDTILFVHADTILIKPYSPPKEIVKEVKEQYKISSFVFTGKDGNVTIALPEAGRKKYAVRFFEQDNSPLLEIKDVKDVMLILDKANFVHSGWFRFELYEDGKLKEKNRLFIPREF